MNLMPKSLKRSLSISRKGKIDQTYILWYQSICKSSDHCSRYLKYGYLCFRCHWLSTLGCLSLSVCYIHDKTKHSVCSNACSYRSFIRLGYRWYFSAYRCDVYSPGCTKCIGFCSDTYVSMDHTSCHCISYLFY